MLESLGRYRHRLGDDTLAHVVGGLLRRARGGEECLAVILQKPDPIGDIIRML